jgi:hypothetical protein
MSSGVYRTNLLQDLGKYVTRERTMLRATVTTGVVAMFIATCLAQDITIGDPGAPGLPGPTGECLLRSVWRMW